MFIEYGLLYNYTVSLFFVNVLMIKKQFSIEHVMYRDKLLCDISGKDLHQMMFDIYMMLGY